MGSPPSQGQAVADAHIMLERHEAMRRQLGPLLGNVSWPDGENPVPCEGPGSLLGEANKAMARAAESWHPLDGHVQGGARRHSGGDGHGDQAAARCC
jgi:hypothetical protein